MAAPLANIAPPLPPGWTEHKGPGGQSYYYNAFTQESTYVRPIVSFPMLAQLQAQPPAKKKKEKPLVKTPIPGTQWIRVKTTEGNIFYSHKERKESFWTVPDEIKDEVEQLERDEVLQKQQEEEAEARRTREAEEERARETERVKKEVQESTKRKAVDQPLEEVSISKRPRIEDVTDEDDEDEESEEEEWQKEAAAQLAAEAEEERKRKEEEEKMLKEEAEAEERKANEARLNMPAKVDLSVDEAKALFKTLLREKDINPLHPWDTSLPLFVKDPRYVLVPSVTARKDVFDEYCRDRARDLRKNNVKKEIEAANPKDTFDRLLKDEVTSTRTSWTDFRRAWKKDRRFFGWGRDDREREKRFREYLKELGERKRAAAQKAEADFFALLRGSNLIRSDSVWKEVKRKLQDDPRYDAVGSSSLREDLFNTFLKAIDQGEAPSAAQESKTEKDVLPVEEELDDEEAERQRREKKEKAVREREARVRADRDRVEADIGRSRQGLNREEDERLFRTMLVDAIRDSQVHWDEAVQLLQKDPRFVNSSLPRNQQIHLFQTHVQQLGDKHRAVLHTLFESYAPSLATEFSELPVKSLLSSLPATKMGLQSENLKQEFDKWQRERTSAARVAFDEMLQENSFVEFWGRLGKIGGEGAAGGVKMDEDGLGEDEGEGGGGRVDMKELAKSVDVTEMEKVLKNDKRYMVFDHVPEQRERWLRDYLSQLSAPKLSVHA